MRGYGLAVDSGPSETRIKLYRLDQRIKDAIKRKDFRTAELLQRQRDALLRATQGRTLKPKTQGRTLYPAAPTTLADLVARLKSVYTLPQPAPAAVTAQTPALAPVAPSDEAAEIADEGVESAEGVMGYWNDLSTTTKVAVGVGALGAAYFLFLRR
jgi:hypothetical protein